MSINDKAVYGPTTDPCIILLVIAVTDEHTLFTLYIVA